MPLLADRFQVVLVGVRWDTNLPDGLIGVRTGDLVDQVLDCLPEVAVVIEPAGEAVSAAPCRVNRLLRIGAAVSLPVIIPALLASVECTEILFEGNGSEDLGKWISLLGVFDAVYLIATPLCFGLVVSD